VLVAGDTGIGKSRLVDEFCGRAARSGALVTIGVCARFISSQCPEEEYMPEFPTITHVALTVSDLNRSVPWYERLFDAKPVLDEDTGPFRHVVWLVGGQTLVGLHQFPDPVDTLPFNERHVGLDHLAFACRDRADLDQWKVYLDELGIANGGVVNAPYGSGLSFRDPDNIALEFFAPPS
jgi:catechol-2,3-dioxygenase